MAGTRPRANASCSNAIRVRASYSARFNSGRSGWFRPFHPAGANGFCAAAACWRPACRHIPCQFHERAADLAHFAEHLLSNSISGVFNVAGPAAPTTMETVITRMRSGRGGTRRTANKSVTWANDKTSARSAACKSGSSCRCG